MLMRLFPWLVSLQLSLISSSDVPFGHPQCFWVAVMTVSQACQFASSVFCPRRQFCPHLPVSLPRDSPEGREDMSWTPLVRTGSTRSSALCGADSVQASECGTAHWSSLRSTRGRTLKFGARGPNRESGCGIIVFFPLWRGQWAFSSLLQWRASVWRTLGSSDSRSAYHLHDQHYPCPSLTSQ